MRCRPVELRCPRPLRGRRESCVSIALRALRADAPQSPHCPAREARLARQLAGVSRATSRPRHAIPSSSQLRRWGSSRTAPRRTIRGMDPQGAPQFDAAVKAAHPHPEYRRTMSDGPEWHSPTALRSKGKRLSVSEGGGNVVSSSPSKRDIGFTTHRSKRSASNTFGRQDLRPEFELVYFRCPPGQAEKSGRGLGARRGGSAVRRATGHGGRKCLSCISGSGCRRSHSLPA